MGDQYMGREFDTQVNDYLSFLDNEYVSAAISLFLILYAGVIAPKLPASILRLFDNWVVQIALFFAIVYISNRNPTVALMAAIAVLVTLMVVNNYVATRQMVNGMRMRSNRDDNNEYFENEGEVLSDMNDDKPYIQVMEENVVVDPNAQEIAAIMDSEHGQMVAGEYPHSETVTEMDMESTMMMTETEGESHGHHGHMHGEQHGGGGHHDKTKVNGIVQSLMEDDTAGFALDDTSSMGSDNAEANHVDAINDNKMVSANAVLEESVNQVAAEIEASTGSELPEDVKEEIKDEVKHTVMKLVKNGKKMNSYDVINVCRAVCKKNGVA